MIKTTIIKLLLLSITITTFFTLKANADDYNLAGLYDGNSLIIAHDKNTNIITGYFEDQYGWDEKYSKPKFECSFYFKGKIEDQNQSIIPIKAWGYRYKDEGEEQNVMGELKIDANKVITINLGGYRLYTCEYFSDDVMDFKRDKKANWINIKFTISKKTYFYDKPDDKAKTDEYLGYNEIVKIIKNKDNWAYIEYQNLKNQKSKKAWVKQTDISEAIKDN